MWKPLPTFDGVGCDWLSGHMCGMNSQRHLFFVTCIQGPRAKKSWKKADTGNGSLTLEYIKALFDGKFTACAESGSDFILDLINAAVVVNEETVTVSICWAVM